MLRFLREPPVSGPALFEVWEATRAGDAGILRRALRSLEKSGLSRDLGRSILIGDRWRDIEAGRRAGVRATILIDRGYDELLPHEPDLRVQSLTDAAAWILQLETDAGERLQDPVVQVPRDQNPIFGDRELPRPFVGVQLIE